jgi:putative MATE family efflux protein
MNTIENKMIDRDVGLQTPVDGGLQVVPPPVDVVKTGDEVIIRGSLWAAIWHMSWPLFLNMTTIAFASFADLYVAGKLGSSTQAAVGVGGQIWFFMVLLAVALSAGTNALVSRMWGEGNVENTTQAARQSIFFAFIFGACSAGVGLLVCRPLLAMLGASQEVQKLGWDFLKFDLIAQLPFTVLWVSNSIFRAMGNAKTPMIIMGLITLQVILLDFGLCLWPLHIGIAGIGMSWGIASILGVALSFMILRRTAIGECLDVRAMLRETSWAWFNRLMKIGIPACIQDLSWVGGNFVLFLIFAHTPDPTSCQASWAIGLRLEEMLGGFPIYALNMAVAVIVGQNLGAKQPERAERAGWQVAATGAIINTVVAMVLYFGAPSLAHLMTADPKVGHYAVQYLQIVGLAQPFVAVWLILGGAMNGAGYTRWPMWITVACLAIFRLPLAWYLTVVLGFAPAGTWSAMALSCMLAGVFTTWRFKTGAWKTQKV